MACNGLYTIHIFNVLLWEGIFTILMSGKVKCRRLFACVRLGAVFACHSRRLSYVGLFWRAAETLEHWLRVDNVCDLGSEQCAGLPAGLQLAAWRFLQTRVTLLLRLYPGTADGDRALLVSPPAPPPEGDTDAPPPLTTRARMAVTLRLGEKLILQRALQFATEKMQEQEALDQELKRQEALDQEVKGQEAEEQVEK